MNPKFVFKHLFTFLKDSSVDIRIRLLYFLQYASLIACLIGTIGMIMLKQSVISMVPNFILFVMSFIGLYLSHAKKKYDLAALIIIIGCANIALPWMFFSAGGNDSGMLIWFLFSVVVTCMMANGKVRIFMAIITTIEDLACMCIGYLYPDTVKPLVGQHAEFVDQLQSFAIVCIFLTAILTIYITTYENQRRKLVEQGIELRNIMQTDALTGTFNRRAYYDEINLYSNGKDADDLVLVAMDVNGLKKINDQLGHAAGDDYICVAARVIGLAMGEYGHIFRTGGDEFMAILHCSVKEAECLEKRLNECIAQDDNSWKEQMAIAVGIVCYEEYRGEKLSEIEKIADKRMYENKAAYYRRNGIDRRR